jgi:thiosulfate dehydrogenase
MVAARDSLPAFVGNDLRCVSCHLDDGRRPHAMPWTGVYARFPQYRARSGTVDRLEDRINDCFERSLAGRRLPVGSREMTDIVAYMALLSRGVPVGGSVPGQGLDSVPAAAPDSARGRAVYATQCARCHGADGAGQPGYPAVWGPRSYSIGAGMARVRALAAFVHANMPYDAPRTLTPQQATDVAAFVNAQPRPDFARKVDDWPTGGAPPDAAYRTRGAVAAPR